MSNARWQQAGMTLVEIMMGMAITALVVSYGVCFFVFYLHSYNATTLQRDVSAIASLALDRMVVGTHTNAGLREVVTTSFQYTTTSNGWKIAYNDIYSNSVWFTYNSNATTILDSDGVIVASQIVAAAVLIPTNAAPTNWCEITVTAKETAGGRTFSNTMSTTVDFRN